MSSRVFSKCCSAPLHPRARGSRSNGSKTQLYTIQRRWSTEASSTSSSWSFPQASEQAARRARASTHYGPLPLPIALKAFRPSPTIPSTTPSLSLTGSSSSTYTKSQLAFPPPPAVLGSQPLYYLARRFPILAEQELKAIPNKTALDYSSFLVGAMETSYPSATTLRAVVRQFRNFLKDSTWQLKTSPLSSSTTKQLELPRARIWAQTIRGLIWLKQYRRARVAVHAMQKLGIKPTGFAWRGICRGWIEQGELSRAEALAVKVFTRPEISHQYRPEERPYYFTDMQADTTGRRKHRSPMSPNSAPLFLVIEALAECGEMERARHLFDQIPEHELTDLLTSDMVAGYLRVGQQDKAQEVIRIMARCGVKPTAIVFNPIVEHAVRNVSMEAAEELVKDMTELGIFPNLFTYKILVRGYITAGRKDEAMECLDRIRASGLETDRALGRILLDGFWSMGELRKGDHGPPAVCDINRTQGVRDEFNIEDLGFVGKPGWSLQCMEWIRDGKFESVEEALQQVLDGSNSTLDSEAVSIIKALADQQEMMRARHWFDRLVSSEDITRSRTEVDSLFLEMLNHMVAGYIKAHQPGDAEAIIGIMSQQGIQPTVETINLMLRWSTSEAEMADAESLVQSMAQFGIAPTQQTFEILCEGYASRGAVDSLQECLAKMDQAGFESSFTASSAEELRSILLGQQESQPSQQQSSSSGILETLCARWIEQGQMTRAEQFVNHLVSNSNVPASKVPHATLIQGWINQSQRHTISSSAIQAIAQSSSSSSTSTSADPSQSLSPSTATPPASTSVPSSKSLNQEFLALEESIAKMRKARSWFDKVPEEERTLDLLNRMIGGYMVLGLEQESEGLIQWMASRRMKPDVVTYNHILDHTVQRLAMPAAEVLVGKMQNGGISPNVDTWNLLIRGYVVRGQLSEATRCLDRMAGKKDVAGSVGSTKSRSDAVVSTGPVKSKAREIIETYDREILDVVIHDAEDRENELGALERKATTQTRRPITQSSFIVEPNEITEQLILSGFGPELKPVQGHGDYSRALELYRNRVMRQKQQKDQLLQGLATLSQQQQLHQGHHHRVEAECQDEEEEEGELIMEHLETLQSLTGEGGLSGSDVGMTDVDWKNDLKWEEMREVERERERELSGRDSQFA